MTTTKKQTPKKKPSSKDDGITKEEFLKILHKVTRPLDPKSGTKPGKARPKTSA